MLVKLLACDVFTREVCRCVADTPHVIDLEFTPKGAHDDSDVLRALLQERIDAAESCGKNYDAIALCLGLCGNSTVGLTSRSTPLVMPRAHDCCSLFLGSAQKWKQHFADAPSTPFSSAGYIEHGGEYVRETDTLRRQMGLQQEYEQYVELYGEENAAYLWKTLHPEELPGSDGRVVFIDVEECPAPHHEEACRKRAEQAGKSFLKLKGSIKWIRKLVYGEWDEKEFLRVRPGEKIAGVYDWDTIVRAVDEE